MSLRRTAAVVIATMLAMLALFAAKAGSRAQNAAMSVTIVSQGPVHVATGPQIVLAHGIVQVKVTVTDGRIIDVTALQLPHDNPHSWDDSTEAAAKLRTEVLAAQSADVNVVSGATYTSRGYARSLQAALDALGMKS
ncbi:FMN-binding protein [Actinocrinis puniceicyclus]|uniref:FMN-binding protein n=1 Tax=Actinocrinis puniceicyclus TaxID=977794 RepID=A0A8J8BBJ8_9ACTN|nr:FMN-binding protein [Actinocrinis puniceicyclus]MBS2964132.1 FMN-binding protein [Actinocrinis puniceicyclus]